MRFLELYLNAYGPFTDLKVDLSAGQEGLHVIYGPNEAGKSTALRALGNLLYGFEHKCEDAYLHDLAKLRVGAKIRSTDHTELAFIRRKGNKDTLLDLEGNPLADAALSRFLAGTSRDVFSSRFGIGFAELREGAAGILAGQGEAGTTLASTGLGGLDVRGVIETLDKEAEDLFKYRGQNQKINQAISRHNEIRNRLKALSVSMEQAHETELLISSLRKKAEEIRNRLEKLNHEKSRLTRLQTAIPKLAKRQDLLVRKAAFGDVIILSNDFSQKRRITQQNLANARTSLFEAEAELEHLKREIENLDIPATILEAKETIDEVKLGLGAFIKALKDRPGLVEAQSRARIQAEETAKRIPGQPSLQALMECDLTTSQRQRLSDLVNEYTRLMGNRESIEKQIAKNTQSLERICDDIDFLPAMRNCQRLKVYLEVVTEAGALEKDREKVLHDIKVNDSQVEIEASRMTGWKGTLDELETLSLPSVDTVTLYAQRFQKIEGQIADLNRRKSDAERRLTRNEQDLAKLLKEGAVPTEEDLESARARREQGWSLVRRAWLEGQDITQEATVYDSTHPLPEAYEAAVLSADEISDLLRTEAAKVERHVTLLAKRQEINIELQEVTDDLNNCMGSLHAAQEEWTSLCVEAGISPLSPQEMTGWLVKIPSIHQRLEQVRSDHLRLEQIEEMIRKHREGLSRHLEQLGERAVAETESLREALLRAKEVVSSIEKTEKERELFRQKELDLRKNLDNDRRSLTTNEAEQASWEKNWREAVGVLGQVVEVAPQSLMDILGQRDEVLSKVNEAEKLAERIRQIDEDACEYRNKAIALTARVAPDLANLPPQESIQILSQRLESAQKAKTRREGLVEQISKMERSIKKQKTSIEELLNQLMCLIHEAGCLHEEDLPQAEERSESFLELQQELERIESELLEIAPKGDLNELIQETAEIDRDMIEGLLASIKEEIGLLERDSSSCHQEIGKNEQILSAINGNDNAARDAEEAQSILAGIQTHAQRYIRLKLASGILRAAVERFRKENQGPLLERAGSIFKTISLGSFTGLETDFNDKDEPVLVGVREGGIQLAIDQMSDGARDQLYLSLRLAHLEMFLDSQLEKMPFIVDDILVHFDDERAVETLKVLGVLSKKTQILFFTHHRHLVELARKSLPEGTLFIHDLPARAWVE